MTTTARPQSSCREVRSTGPDPRSCPLDIIAGDLRRARKVCEDLDAISGSETLDPDLTRQALRGLRTDLPRHLRDTTEDLLPLLRRRCPPGDGLARSLARIGNDLDLARDGLPDLCNIVASGLGTGHPPTMPDAVTLACGTRRLRRYLMAGKAILLPLARSLLTARDRQTLCLRLQERRGTDPGRFRHGSAP